jgi:hypothetical protein
VEVTGPVVLQGKPAADAIPTKQDLLQVWFAGVHSDVGGSYPQLQSGLANITLQWMIDEARKAGAVFDEPRVRMVLGTPGSGEPTSETAALAPLYEKPKSSTLHHSLHGVWWLLELLPHRYYDKDDSSVKKRIPLGAYRKIPKGSLVHPSVRQRLKNPCYQPKNVTGDELVDPRSASSSPLDTDVYLHFEPKLCRDYTLRQNWLVVFVVTVLELGLAFYAASWMAVLAHRYVHPAHAFTDLWNGWFALEGFVMNHWFSKITKGADFLWAMLVVTVAVIGGKFISILRKPRA